MHTGTRFWFENLTGRDHLGDLGVDVRILLKWNLKKMAFEVWNGMV
jgi:hypothetical protein